MSQFLSALPMSFSAISESMCRRQDKHVLGVNTRFRLGVDGANEANEQQQQASTPSVRTMSKDDNVPRVCCTRLHVSVCNQRPDDVTGPAAERDSVCEQDSVGEQDGPPAVIKPVTDAITRRTKLMLNSTAPSDFAKEQMTLGAPRDQAWTCQTRSVASVGGALSEP